MDAFAVRDRRPSILVDRMARAWLVLGCGVAVIAALCAAGETADLFFSASHGIVENVEYQNQISLDMLKIA